MSPCRTLSLVQFDDHEIWGAPVNAAGGLEAPEPAPAPSAAPAAPAGRLYKSAGCEEPVDAVVALPGHRHRHTAAHAVAPTTRPEASTPSITINSQIPRPTTIDDPAIAEVLAAPVAKVEDHTGFTSWFRRSGSTPLPDAPVSLGDAPTETAKAALLGPAGAIASGVAAGLSQVGALSANMFAAIAFIITAVAGAINAHLSGSIGLATGAVFLVVCAAGAWMLDAADRWAGWVLPSYILMAASVVAGQFGDAAPGASIVGQAMVIVSSLITLAPWLAAAAVAGVAVPLLRGKRN